MKLTTAKRGAPKIKAAKRGRPPTGDKSMTSTERARLFRMRNPNYNKR